MSMGIGYSGANPDGAPVAVLRTGRRPIRSVRRAICEAHVFVIDDYHQRWPNHA